MVINQSTKPSPITVGVDIVAISRLSKILVRFPQKFPRRILTPCERLLLPECFKAKVVFLAKRWAAKEALSKALGTGVGQRFSFQDASIFSRKNCKPKVELSHTVIEHFMIEHCEMSWSDEKDYVAAFCLLTLKKNT